MLSPAAPGPPGLLAASLKKSGLEGPLKMDCRSRFGLALWVLFRTAPLKADLTAFVLAAFSAAAASPTSGTCAGAGETPVRVRSGTRTATESSASRSLAARRLLALPRPPVGVWVLFSTSTRDISEGLLERWATGAPCAALILRSLATRMGSDMVPPAGLLDRIAVGKATGVALAIDQLRSTSFTASRTARTLSVFSTSSI
mmetsp:Transcript_46972/g.102185  ORF Transcript_46972/g.102185 Transcript_46972/m.102185 type:complete len:201 (+) Transcript_46972:2153-2755(+)